MSKVNEMLKEQLIPSMEELTPLSGQNVEIELKNCVQKLGNSGLDWNIHFEAITTIRRAVVHHTNETFPNILKFKPIIVAILDHVDNLRSLVSRNAINAIGDFFTVLGKGLDSEVDGILPRILKKYGESNKFFESESDKALIQLINNTTPTKVMNVLLNQLSVSKNPAIRGKISFLMARLITGKMGAQILKYKDLNKLVQSLVQLSQDASAEARVRAKQTLFAFYNYHANDADFEKNLPKLQLNPVDGKLIRDIVEKMKKEKSLEDSVPNSPAMVTSPNSHTGQPVSVPTSPISPHHNTAAFDPTSSAPTTPLTQTKKTLAASSSTSTPVTPARPKTPTNTTTGLARPKTPTSASAQSKIPKFGKTLRDPVSLPPKKGTDAPEEEVEDDTSSQSGDGDADIVFQGLPKAPVVVGNDMEENISVCVRIRPLDDSEKRSQRPIWKASSSDGETNDTVQCTDERLNKTVSYVFDYSFGPEDRDTQAIYDSVGANIVQSVMEGYNGTIFAYGQTNSGKTYTMMGTEDNPGIIPIAIEEVFNYIKDSTEREFLLRVSYMEIYNEVINDLLRPEGSNLTIRDDKKRGIFIDGLKEEIVVSPEHVVHVINSGEAHRHVASTDYNLISSRSHTVFRMIIESNLIDDPSDKKNNRVSALTLIDLAGSEKVVSDSIIRRREGAYINKSLLTLGTIISKLSERKKGEKVGYLPYRDSKLTRILEPSLSGNSRIAIIATATAGSASFEETNNTLKFALRAKKVTNKAKLNQDNEKLLLMKYREQIDDLRKKLEVAQEAEKKLQELQDKPVANSSQLDELRQELNEQESIRFSLEEKIKQLTKLILVSANIGPTQQVSPGSRERSSSGSNDQFFKRSRSISLRLTNPEILLKQQSPTRKSAQPAEASSSFSERSLSKSPSVDDPFEKKLSSLQKVNQALSIKIEALQQQADWRDKQITKLKQEVKERDQKIEALLNKVPGLEEVKKMLTEQYQKQFDILQDSIQDKDIQLEIHRSDNSLMNERLADLELRVNRN